MTPSTELVVALYVLLSFISIGFMLLVKSKCCGKFGGKDIGQIGPSLTEMNILDTNPGIDENRRDSKLG